jgi:hypothetical protein
MTAIASERGRQLIAGGGIALAALLWIVQPWRGIDPFVYPPHAQMLLLPFGVMPPTAAVAIWTALNVFCLWHAAERLGPRRDLALLACLPPAALLMVATGYPAGFLALMAVLVLTLGQSRPGLAGLCLALMTVHPPVALLLLLLVLLRGHWRAAASAAAWAVALFAVSVITVGLPAWTQYAQYGAMP